MVGNIYDQLLMDKQKKIIGSYNCFSSGACLLPNLKLKFILSGLILFFREVLTKKSKIIQEQEDLVMHLNSARTLVLLFHHFGYHGCIQKLLEFGEKSGMF